MTESSRDKTIEVMARALVRRRIEFNHMYESKVRDPEWLQRAEDSSWEYFKVDAEAVYTHLQASGMAVVPGWQPIESAPKGVTILLMGGVYQGLPFAGRWDEKWLFPDRPWLAECSGSRLYAHVPKRWMPLPAASPYGKAVGEEKDDG